MPGLPGAAHIAASCGDCASFHASACSRPPDPSSRILMAGELREYDDDDTGLVARAAPGDNAEPLTVSDLAQALKRTVEDRFGFVRLRGELSGVKRAASGHLYACLKDEGAVIDAVMWRGSMARLAFNPEDGLEVVASGKITTYPGRSKYQIVIERMELAGD